jgi:hypothetical protein
MDVSSFRKIATWTKVKLSFRITRYGIANGATALSACGLIIRSGAGTAIKRIADRTLVKTLFILAETAKMTAAHGQLFWSTIAVST